MQIFKNFNKVKTINIKPIKTEKDYQVTLERFEILFDAPMRTPESGEADILALLIEEFENKNYPIEVLSK